MSPEFTCIDHQCNGKIQWDMLLLRKGMKLKKGDGFWKVDGKTHGLYIGIYSVEPQYYRFGIPQGRDVYTDGSIYNRNMGISHGHQYANTLKRSFIRTRNKRLLSGISYDRHASRANK